MAKPKVAGFYKKDGETKPITKSTGLHRETGQDKPSTWKDDSIQSMNPTPENVAVRYVHNEATMSPAEKEKTREEVRSNPMFHGATGYTPRLFEDVAIAYPRSSFARAKKKKE